MLQQAMIPPMALRNSALMRSRNSYGESDRRSGAKFATAIVCSAMPMLMVPRASQVKLLFLGAGGECLRFSDAD